MQENTRVIYIKANANTKASTNTNNGKSFIIVLAFTFQKCELRQRRHKCKCTAARLAQSVEHLTAEQKVAGAIRGANTEGFKITEK